LVWSGGPRDRNNPDTLRLLPELRRLLTEGKLAAAHKLAADMLAGPPEVMRFYEPLADLPFFLDHGDSVAPTAESLTNADGLKLGGNEEATPPFYERWLDLATAQGGVAYTRKNVAYQRDYFISALDHVLLIRLSAGERGKISLRLRLDRGERDNFATRYLDTIQAFDRSGLILSGRTAGEEGVRFCAVAAVKPSGGDVTTIGDTICITQADSLIIAAAGATSFREKDPATSAQSRVRAALENDWDVLLEQFLFR
jgi:alpha-L-fucosidase 2